MSGDQLKRKIISFRVSDDEYDTVAEISRKHGFASVSLFARSATLTSDSSRFIDSPLDVDINRLWRRLEALTMALERMVARAM